MPSLLGTGTKCVKKGEKSILDNVEPMNFLFLQFLHTKSYNEILLTYLVPGQSYEKKIILSPTLSRIEFSFFFHAISTGSKYVEKTTLVRFIRVIKVKFK